MAVRLGDYYFDGPYAGADDLDKSPGVLAVINNFHGRQSVTDILQTPNLRQEAHRMVKREEDMSGEKSDYETTVLFAVLNMPHEPESARKRIIEAFADEMRLPVALKETGRQDDLPE